MFEKIINEMKQGKSFTGEYKGSHFIEHFGYSQVKDLFYVYNEFDIEPSYYTEAEIQEILKKAIVWTQPQY